MKSELKQKNPSRALALRGLDACLATAGKAQILAALWLLVSMNLAGCAAVHAELDEMRRARIAEEQQRQEDANRRIAVAKAKREARCASFGFQERTPEFANCVMQLYQQERQEINALGAALISSGALLSQPNHVPVTATLPTLQPLSVPPPPPIQRPLSTTCQTDSVGITRCTTN